MVVGTMTIQLRLRDRQSLKDKRSVIKSLTARVQHRFNVSIAETADNDRWQSAELGVAAVSNSAAHANETLEHVIGFIERERPDVEVIDYTVEILHV